VEIRKGVSDPDMGHPSGWPGGYEYTWFRRAADRPGACLPYEPLGRVPVLNPAEESASPSRCPPDLVVMKPVTPSLLQRVFGFVARSTIIHVLSYLIVGMASYYLVVRHYWTGDRALPWLRDPEAEFVQRWFLPAQFARGVLYGIALFPLREPLLRMKRLGGLVVASLLLLVGSIAGISGIIEDWVYTTTFHLGLFLAHLPEVVIQTLLYGYLLLAWEGRVESRRRTRGARLS
jgi:hypothetical protein